MFCYWLVYWKLLEKIPRIRIFELDPAHYLSGHNYSWDAILRFTNENLKLIKYRKVSVCRKHDKGWYFYDLQGLC